MPIEDAGTPPDAGQTPEVPASQETGQPTESAQPSEGQHQPAPTGEEFFDPSQVPEALKPAYKQMQRAFTKKTQHLANQREKIAAYDQFMADPVGQMQTLARQYGFNMTRAEAKAAVNESQSGVEEWTPNSWDDVVNKASEAAKQQAYNEIMERFQPMVQEFQRSRRSQIESQLDAEVPEWRQYEDEMAETLQKHPSLLQDPEMLVRLAVPKSVLEGRAMQAALKRLEGKANHANVSGGSTTSREPKLDPNKRLTFSEAVASAKQQLQKKGVR